ncbi:sequestosome-1-like isoform X2 [Paramacrobiotus metropolitanus]|nr:sequestosome-1-like isoform X2 [Paramacrobiotus metropolitanus]
MCHNATNLHLIEYRRGKSQIHMALDYGRKIKLYVDPDGEIRRLTLSSTANFEILRNRICLLLNRENFRVFWKDSEGDLIVCCSEDEFVEACASCPPHDLLRIYIRNKPAETNANRGTSASIYLHDAVCDACNKEISGNRWKCLECADYYLCLACYHSGIHSMHDVLLICNPETKGLKRLLAKRYDASAPTKGHCDRNNGSVGRNMQRLPPEKGVNGDIPLFSHGSG